MDDNRVFLDYGDPSDMRVMYGHSYNSLMAIRDAETRILSGLLTIESTNCVDNFGQCHMVNTDGNVETIIGTQEDISRLVDAQARYHRETNTPEHETADSEPSLEDVFEGSNKIPPNSGSLTVKENTSRFSGAVWYSAIQQKKITLAGVGGIGSYVGFLLARLYPDIICLYDPDIVEAANMSGQLYGQQDIGVKKVDALARTMNNYARYLSVLALDSKFDQRCDATDIMICGFDNMEARQSAFLKWEEHVDRKTHEGKTKCLLIDGRLAAEEFQVFAIQGNDERALLEYKRKWLFGDGEAEETVCSYKQTTFMANMIASVIVNVFVNFVANECNPPIRREVPFMTAYSADTMFLKVEI